MPLHVDGKRRITFDRGPPTFSAFAGGGIALAIVGGGIYITADKVFAIVGTAIAAIVIMGLARRWILECDIAAKRLKAVRKLFGYWSRTKVDCRFDECEAFGVYETDSEDVSYGLFVKLRTGNGCRFRCTSKVSRQFPASLAC